MIKQGGLGQQWVDIEFDWFGQLSKNKAKFCIEWKSKHVTFTVDVEGNPYLHPNLNSGYGEGLWGYDVAEWFVYNPESGVYLECNLSPQGAWWVQSFDAPRKRMDKQYYEDFGITANGNIAVKGWSAQLSMPDFLLKSVLGEGEWRHNVCFILGQDSRQYFSWTELHSAQPDFHRPDEFIHTMAMA